MYSTNQRLIDQSYEERVKDLEIKAYNSELRYLRNEISDYHWDLFISIKREVTERHRGFISTEDYGYNHRTLLAHKTMKALREALKVRPQAFHYVFVHEFGASKIGHLHFLVQIAKPIEKSKIYRTLETFHHDFKKQRLGFHYKEKGTNEVFIQSKEKVLSYFTKSELKHSWTKGPFGLIPYKRAEFSKYFSKAKYIPYIKDYYKIDIKDHNELLKAHSLPLSEDISS